MKATQQFIEDAIKGGWTHAWTCAFIQYSESWILTFIDEDKQYSIVLDPLAWQAVGKTRGWSQKERDNRSPMFHPAAGQWLFMWHQFIAYLADGKSIEEALQALTN